MWVPHFRLLGCWIYHITKHDLQCTRPIVPTVGSGDEQNPRSHEQKVFYRHRNHHDVGPPKLEADMSLGLQYRKPFISFQNWMKGQREQFRRRVWPWPRLSTSETWCRRVLSCSDCQVIEVPQETGLEILPSLCSILCIINQSKDTSAQTHHGTSKDLKRSHRFYLVLQDALDSAAEKNPVSS